MPRLALQDDPSNIDNNDSKVIVFGSGGELERAGKTLLATNYAAECALKGERVALVYAAPDSDLGYTWMDQRDENAHLRPLHIPSYLASGSLEDSLIKLRTKFDRIIVDCEGIDTAEFQSVLTSADVFINIANKPGKDEKTHEILRMMGGETDGKGYHYLTRIISEVQKLRSDRPLIVSSIINDVADQEEENAARDLLQSYPLLGDVIAVVRHRSEYCLAAEQGLAIFEYHEDETFPTAVDEIKQMFQRIEDLLKDA
jgi:cellulose biosynthesis protein BcsQ